MVGLCLLFAVSPSQASHFDIVDGRITLHDDVYYLSARLDLELSDAAREAMHSGLPLTLELQIVLERPRRWMWDDSVAKLSQRYRLRFHDLSGRYILSNLNSGDSANYTYESALLGALGNVEMLPIIDRRLLEEGETYQVSIRARLDLSELPQPLRSLALVSRQWRLSSDWYRWQLQV